MDDGLTDWARAVIEQDVRCPNCETLIGDDPAFEYGLGVCCFDDDCRVNCFEPDVVVE